MSANGRIPESFIETVLARTDIVSLIQESLTLKKNGANFSACCPFHQEKTPSFTVSPSKQFYHCFGCGAHGDAIRFLMEQHNLTFVDAVEKLSTRLGLSVPKDPQEVAKAQQKSAKTHVLNEVADFYAAQLKAHPAAKTAVDYLKKRGLTGVIAKKFNLGFAPPGWDNLTRQFLHQADKQKVLLETGLILKKEDQQHFYDRFRARIMFPIRDRQGQTIGFGARVLDQSQPKYLNSSESPLFQKGHCLYGIYEALQERSKWQRALVVEGYLDVIALAQYGVIGAVATLGTAMTTHHLTQLFQYVNEVVFCFDGDQAGQNAAWKALQLVLPLLTQERQVRFVFFPQGEDPDSYIRQQGKVAFETLVQNSTPLADYFFASLTQMVPPNSVDNCARLASMARPLLEQMPPGIFKEMLFEQLARIVASSPEVVRGKPARRSFGMGQRWPQKPSFPPSPAPLPLEPAFIASAILMRLPGLFANLPQKIYLTQEMVAPGLELLRAISVFLHNTPTASSEALKQHLQTHGFELKRLNECEEKLALLPEEASLAAELSGAIARLEVIGRKQAAKKLLQKAKKMELTEEEKKQLKEFLASRESIG